MRTTLVVLLMVGLAFAVTDLNSFVGAATVVPTVAVITGSTRRSIPISSVTGGRTSPVPAPS